MEAKGPLIITNKDEMRRWSQSMRAQGKTIGLIPTMGFLHDGHLSLIHQAHAHTQLTVVSTYVNPGQFAASEDFSTYPSDFQSDSDKLRAVVPGGVDVVFNPHNLYDYGGVRDLDFGIKVIGSELVREDGGLAMSFRNVLLSLEDRKKIVDQESLEAVEEVKGAVVFCVAAWFGKVRKPANAERDRMSRCYISDLVSQCAEDGLKIWQRKEERWHRTWKRIKKRWWHDGRRGGERQWLRMGRREVEMMMEHEDRW
ncbi:pantoate-beta-alanine ligase [Actinidia rufa]|uniref:Pantoate--beta-alanine ligase n=1 Tax=Actinidia rufa TaxID=165716 RepID=A0A7J0HAL0_9ERIC|nr:pantoate-beta-alanine ligase [Actinidia rufa]